MHDPTVAGERLDHAAGDVLRALWPLVGSEAGVMVVGAVCRDTLHAALGMPGFLTATADLDLALGVDGWEPYEALTRGLKRIAGSGSRIRYLVGGTLVDLVPFGDVEDPVGEVRLPRDEDPNRMSVFGFREVYARASVLGLPGVPSVRLPTPAGYTALKLKAWIDRRAYHESKDGRDLGTAMSWYQQSREVQERLYDPQEGDSAAEGLLEEWGFDPDAAAVELLVRDAMATVGPARHAELRALWRGVDDDLLATDLGGPSHRPRGRAADPRVVAVRRAIDRRSPD